MSADTGLALMDLVGLLEPADVDDGVAHRAPSLEQGGLSATINSATFGLAAPALNISDAHDDEKSDQKHEPDRVDRRFDLRRKPTTEDRAKEHEEQAPAVEPGERDDVDHAEVDG